jgi:hypothetical protein
VDAMTPKQRLIGAIKGEEIDRIPWSPFLAYFWEAQPLEVQKSGQLKFLEEIGADPLFRGFHRLFKIDRKKCVVNETIRGNEKVVNYETPIGKLSAGYRYTPTSNSWFIVDHPVKSKNDLKILIYLNDDMIIASDMEEYFMDSEDLGERGLYIPVIGSEYKTSFQSLVEYWIGTEQLVYFIMDYPELIEECLHSMRINSIKSTKISVNSAAEAFIFWEDSSTTNISPSYFQKYVMPEINEWGEIIHDAGKFLIHHACGHLKALIPYISQTKIDMLESVTPPPTGNIDLFDTRELLPKHIGLIGGIEPTMFLNCSLEVLESCVSDILSRMKSTRYILANSDSCPPGVSIEKFKLVSKLVKNI